MIEHKLPAQRDYRVTKRIAYIVTAFVIVLFGIYLSRNLPTSQPLQIQNESDVLIKVGNETLYYKDLETELSRYPDNKNENAKAILMQKLITDSVILQGGADEELIEVDSSTFNSLEKDYGKRIQLVESVKQQLESNSIETEGYVVSIWFRNNGYIGPMGLEKSKTTARQKLEVLWKEVSEGRMSVQKAGDIIANDTSLAQLDIAYKNNAIFPFTATKGNNKPITLNKDLDEELLELQNGEVSEIYVGQGVDPDTGERYEAMYAFGQITEKKVSHSEYTSFDDWLNIKNQIYEVRY